MPILEYRCVSCEKTAEFLVLAGDRRLEPVCPRCGASGMSRLLSTFAAHAGHGAKEADAMCGDGPCAMPGMCGPSACGLGER